MLRGASCGATWDAARKIIGQPTELAITRLGLEVQLLCKADPSSWDPLHGSSPVHFAGHVHAKALLKGIKSSAEEE